VRPHSPKTFCLGCQDYVAKRKSSLHINQQVITFPPQPNGNSPLVALIGCGSPVNMLLLWGHGVPFLGLLVVPPPVIKECPGILNEL